jgi:hypothetical protein
VGYYLKSFSWSRLKIKDSQLKEKALKKILKINQDYAIAIPREKIIWHFSKYALPRRSVQVFLDVCFARAEIPKHLLLFIVSNVYDKMNDRGNPNRHFSLKKVAAAYNGGLAIDDLVTFNSDGMYEEVKRN